MKCILNSVYERFGMNKTNQRCEIVDSEKYKNIEKIHSILRVSRLDGGLYLVSYINTLSENVYIQEEKESCRNFYQKMKNLYEIQQDSINTAVHIATATTSYARIYMHDFKNLRNNPCYYSDTDSVFLKKPLPENSISSNQLGLFKLEEEKIDCIFLAPKIYIYKTKNNENILKFKGVNKKILLL